MEDWELRDCEERIERAYEMGRLFATEPKSASFIKSKKTAMKEKNN